MTFYDMHGHYRACCEGLPSLSGCATFGKVPSHHEQLLPAAVVNAALSLKSALQTYRFVYISFELTFELQDGPGSTTETFNLCIGRRDAAGPGQAAHWNKQARRLQSTWRC